MEIGLDISIILLLINLKSFNTIVYILYFVLYLLCL